MVVVMLPLTICIILSPDLWNHELMDKCLQKQALCYTPFRVSGPGLFRVFSSVTLITNVLSTGSGVLVEVAGCSFPDDFADWLVVTHGHQKKKFGYYSSLSPRY